MEAIKRARSLKARRYRNRRLGDFLKELELSEGRATGIPTIQEELRKNGSPAARIETDVERSYFLIEIPCREGFETMGLQREVANEPETEPKTEPKKKHKRELKTQDVVLALIVSDSTISISEIVQKCGKSRTTVQTCIKRLKDSGRIKREGSNKGGRWVVL